jgi:hypothetical protein
MTTLAAPAQPGQAAAPQPVPWSKLAWVSWRQYRPAAVGLAAFFGALALYLAIEGLHIRSAYAAVTSCHPATSSACSDVTNLFGNAYHPTGEVTADLLQAVPVLVGVFAGAPILARELDSGTSRFAWTQGAGRIRWTVARLALPAVTVTAAAAAFSQLFGWFYQPFFALGMDSRIGPQYFDLTGVALAAWTLAAFAVGVLAGVLIRRVVPAVAAAMAAWAGLMLATVVFLRSHYLAPLLSNSKSSIGPSSAGNGPVWEISQWWNGPNGKPVSNSTINGILQRAPVQSVRQTGPHSFTELADPSQWLFRHGYSQWTSYQPGGRYWHFQFIEAGWLLALSVLLIVVTIWLVRHRGA